MSEGSAQAAPGRLGSSPYPTIEIPAGSYEIPAVELAAGRDSARTYRVRIKEPYMMGVAEVSQGLWRSVMGVNPSTFHACGDDCPVDSITLSDAALFANALSVKENLIPCYAIHGNDVGWGGGDRCDGYRIPTESEWSAAAVFVGGSALLGLGLHEVSSPLVPHPVTGERAVHARDLEGNVWEWTCDHWASQLDDAPPGSGRGAGAPLSDGEGIRVVRGGSWLSPLSRRGIALRSWEPADRRSLDLGVRLVRDAVPPARARSVSRNSMAKIKPITNH